MEPVKPARPIITEEPIQPRNKFLFVMSYIRFCETFMETNRDDFSILELEQIEAQCEKIKELSRRMRCSK